MNWKVRVLESGRSGMIEYLEGGDTCQCYWEFGSDDVIAIITVPSAGEWDHKYSWAKGRRQEILSRMANETLKRRAPTAVIEWDEPRSCIYLREKRQK